MGASELHMASPGIVGHRLPALRTERLAFGPGDTLMLATDGVERRLAQALSGGAAARGDGAAALLRQFATGKDDALLVLVRHQPEPAIRGDATAPQTIESRYRAALGTYLASAQEAALLNAYELGRQIMDSGGGLLDLSAVHQAALQTSITGVGLTSDAAAASRAHEFLSEALAPFEMAQLLLLDRSETEAEELQIIVDEGRRLAQLIDDFLDLQRIDRGAVRIEPTDLELASVIDALAARLPVDPRHPQTVDLPGDLPPVCADHERILQVLINLVTNARKYSPAGVPVCLSATVCDDTVRVTVADTGLGIEPDAIPNLFVEFYRVQTPDRQGIAGTGLGLSIAKKISVAR